MEVIERRIKYNRPDSFTIWPLGDFHLGSVHCAEDEIIKVVDQVKETPNSYWIGMGDYADCITVDDKRFDIEGFPKWLQKDNIVESQRQRVREILMPIKAKCLGLLTGNHEEEIHRRHNNDIIRNLCQDLGVPYAGYHAYFVLTFSRGKGPDSDVKQIIIHAWHGSGAAQTEGARLMRLMRLVNDIQADIYLMGHLHAITSYTPDRLIYSRGRIKSVRLVATMTGSWLRGYSQPKGGQHLNPSYIEMKGYKPARIGCPVIKIKPQTREVSIES